MKKTKILSWIIIILFAFAVVNYLYRVMYGYRYSGTAERISDIPVLSDQPLRKTLGRNSFGTPIEFYTFKTLYFGGAKNVGMIRFKCNKEDFIYLFFYNKDYREAEIDWWASDSDGEVYSVMKGNEIGRSDAGKTLKNHGEFLPAQTLEEIISSVSESDYFGHAEKIIGIWDIESETATIIASYNIR